MDYFMGVDLGGRRIIKKIFDERGRVASKAVKEYPHVINPLKETVELDMDELWKAFKQSVKAALKNFKAERSQIIGLAISDQGDTFVPLDNHFKPLRKAITYLDNRSEEESKLIEREIGIEKIYKVTGQPHVFPSYPATKILWIRKNEPEIFKKTVIYAPIESYLIYKLTGTFVCDYSGATLSLMFDIKKKKWWSEMLEFLHIDETQLPELKPSGTIIGNVTNSASKEIGLSLKTMVSTGAHDHAAAAIGAGNIKPNIVTESTGAVLGLVTTLNKPIYNKKRIAPCNCHAIENKYLLLLYGKTGGMVLKWFRDEFCQEEIREAKLRKVDAYNILAKKASKIQPGSNNLIMLPHLMGAGMPENNPKARGVLFGLTLGHRKAHVIRAIMESIAFMLRRNIELLKELGINVNEVRSIGGGARSKLWNQIKADVTHIPVVTLQVEEAASLGVAMLAGLALKAFNSIDEACNTMVHFKKKYLPNPKNMNIYNERYQIYINIYECLKNLF
ncbi:MAG: FGGY family carbohydrate kinase [Candidatus Bathyarchaeia archaeon]